MKRLTKPQAGFFVVVAVAAAVVAAAQPAAARIAGMRCFPNPNYGGGSGGGARVDHSATSAFPIVCVYPSARSLEDDDLAEQQSEVVSQASEEQQQPQFQRRPDDLIHIWRRGLRLRNRAASRFFNVAYPQGSRLLPRLYK